MELQRERPPAYNHHASASLNGLSGLNLPDVPSHDPSAIRRASTITLPDIKSLGLPESNRALPPLKNGSHTPTWPHHSFPSVPNHLPRPSVEYAGSPMEVDRDSVMSYEGNGVRAQSVMSVEDAETRMAAEALSGLKNLDFVRSPSSRSTTIQPLQPLQPMGPPAAPAVKTEEGREQEPILQLLTTQHPWVGGTINGSLSAYEATKHYSPAFVRTGAEFVERTIGSPIANTVGAASRWTGVESGVRRYLGDRRPSEIDTRTGSKRRRQEDSPDLNTDVEKGLPSPHVYHYRSRAGSQASFAESLPAYDANRSPPYEESGSQLATVQRPATARRESSSYNWRQQLMITTSGLGVALSESSLRSLKYCLRLLETATTHLASVMNALKNLLNEYQGGQQRNGVNGHQLDQHQAAASRMISDRIKALGDDIMGTLHKVINAVSRYAGGALPENASALVRRQLMSVPQRWRLANDQAAQQTHEAHHDEAVTSGNRFLQFGVQSLDMFEQIGLVLTETIRSAEKWLDSMGRRRESQVTNGHVNGMNGEKMGQEGYRNDTVMQEKL